MNDANNPQIIKRTGNLVKKDVPKVSIVIPCYKVALYVAETLDSVFAQTFINYEVIVVNDGSPDTAEFEEVIKPYLEKIIYLHKKVNGGLPAARNSGIEIARGELVAFLDSDDVWLPEFLAEQISFLEKNGYDMVYPNALLFGDNQSAGKTYMDVCPSEGDVKLESLINMKCNVIASGVLARTKSVLSVGMFDEEARVGEDFDMWTRMAHDGARIGYQRRILLKYRVRPGSLSGNPLQRVERSMLAMERIREKIDISPEESEAIAKNETYFQHLWHLEKGKLLLLEKQFQKARREFQLANNFERRLKLSVIIFLSHISPSFLLYLFKNIRRDEISFIHSERL